MRPDLDTPYTPPTPHPPPWWPPPLATRRATSQALSFPPTLVAVRSADAATFAGKEGAALRANGLHMSRERSSHHIIPHAVVEPCPKTSGGQAGVVQSMVRE